MRSRSQRNVAKPALIGTALSAVSGLRGAPEVDVSSLLSTAVGRLRCVSALEGLSYALLFFVAMPLKYGLGEPGMVRVMGMAHGVLFVAFSAALLAAWYERRWSVTRPAVLMALSVVPLGAIWIEHSLRRTDSGTSSSAATLPP